MSRLENAASLLLLLASSAWAGTPLGTGPLTLTGSGGRFPDAAFSVASDRYLVAWTDYSLSPARVCGTFLSPDGAVIGATFCISSTAGNGFFPAVVWNSRDDEFLVAFDSDRGGQDRTYAQRVRASDGMLLGGEVSVSPAQGIRPAVAYSATSNAYLVVWYFPNATTDVFAAKLAADGTVIGTVNVSDDATYSGYPAVAWASSTDTFLVTWDDSAANDRIFARRVSAASGQPVGVSFPVTNSGVSSRSNVAYDPVLDRFLVGFNEVPPGNSFDQVGRFVTPSGALGPGPFPIAATTEFEGDTLFGGDVAVAEFGGRYFGSFELTNGHAGQELDTDGGQVGGRVTLGTGEAHALSNAVDPRRSRFLGIWEALVGSNYEVRMRLYQADDVRAPPPPSPFTATWQGSQLQLQWTAPAALDVARIVVRGSVTAPPQSVSDGDSVHDAASAPNATGSATWTPPVGTTVYLAGFALDSAQNASAPASISTDRPELDSGVPSDGGTGGGGGTDGGETTPDGGTDPGRRITSGCGCSATQWTSAFGLLLLIRLGRRRSGRRGGTHSTRLAALAQGERGCSARGP